MKIVDNRPIDNSIATKPHFMKYYLPHPNANVARFIRVLSKCWLKKRGKRIELRGSELEQWPEENRSCEAWYSADFF